MTTANVSSGFFLAFPSLNTCLYFKFKKHFRVGLPEISCQKFHLWNLISAVFPRQPLFSLFFGELLLPIPYVQEKLSFQCPTDKDGCLTQAWPIRCSLWGILCRGINWWETDDLSEPSTPNHWAPDHPWALWFQAFSTDFIVFFCFIYIVNSQCLFPFKLAPVNFWGFQPKNHLVYHPNRLGKGEEGRKNTACFKCIPIICRQWALKHFF